jgi:hypothetical protein
MISGVKEISEAVSDLKKEHEDPHAERLAIPFRVIVMSRGGTRERRELPSVFSDLIASSLANLERTGVEYFRSVKAMPLVFLI